MSLSSKNTKKKNIKKQDQIRLKKKKKIQQNTCIMKFQTIGKQLKFWSNLKWVKLQILNRLKF